MADPQLDAYRDAAKIAAAAAPSASERTMEISTGQAKLSGLTKQMKELGGIIGDAEADIAAARTAADAAAEQLAQNKLNGTLDVLKQNFDLRKQTVLKLRALGVAISDPYVP